MNRWSAVVRQEILCISRERLPQLVLAVFLGMIAASAFIGSAAKGTVSRVYQEAVNQGLTTAANPFDGFSPLYYARNTVIYIVLIGALLAIVVGVQSTLRDRRARTADLVFSRDLPARLYLGAKLCGLGLFLLVLLAVSAVINILCIAAVSGQLLSPAGTLRMLGLYAVAWLFLIPFVCLGMLSGLYAASGTAALFVPIVIWSIIIFVLPLLGTAAEPISLLNPVAAPPGSQTQTGFLP
ncbi:MAG: ABC transporter permease [Actinomycetota bacterium]|nr:ABC transporter permease [Actinomycetota bacterium]